MIPEAPIRFWQYFDFLTLGILTIVIGLLLILHRQKHGSLLKTISATVANNQKSSLIFSITMSVCFPLYYAFIWLWVAPLTNMPAAFYYLLATSACFELIFVWVPSIQGKKKIIHELAAGFVGFAMFVMPLLILLYGYGLTGGMKVAILSFLAVTVTLAVLLSQVRLREYVFMFEVVFLVAFLSTISVIAHG